MGNKRRNGLLFSLLSTLLLLNLTNNSDAALYESCDEFLNEESGIQTETRGTIYDVFHAWADSVFESADKDFIYGAGLGDSLSYSVPIEKGDIRITRKRMLNETGEIEYTTTFRVYNYDFDKCNIYQLSIYSKGGTAVDDTDKEIINAKGSVVGYKDDGETQTFSVDFVSDRDFNLVPVMGEMRNINYYDAKKLYLNMLAELGETLYGDGNFRLPVR